MLKKNIGIHWLSKFCLHWASQEGMEKLLMPGSYPKGFDLIGLVCI